MMAYDPVREAYMVMKRHICLQTSACFLVDIGHHYIQGVLLASSTFKQCWTTCTLPETNSLHPKMDGWKTSLSFWEFAYFQGGGHKLVLGRAISCESFKIWTSKSTCLPSSSLMMSLPPHSDPVGISEVWYQAHWKFSGPLKQSHTPTKTTLLRK